MNVSAELYIISSEFRTANTAVPSVPYLCVKKILRIVGPILTTEGHRGKAQRRTENL